jgi:hypothetical protein
VGDDGRRLRLRLGLRRFGASLRAGETFGGDFEEDVFDAAVVWARARADAADFVHGALRAHVLHSDAKDHRGHELEGVAQQELTRNVQPISISLSASL